MTVRLRIRSQRCYMLGTQSVQVVRNFTTWASWRLAIIFSTREGTSRIGAGAAVVWTGLSSARTETTLFC